MKKKIEQAILAALEAWETPDSPEAFAIAMQELKNAYMDEIMEGPRDE
jgi:hypothetical protein